MQEAGRIKHFFHSNNPMLLITGRRSQKRADLLTAAADLAQPDQMVLRVRGRSTCYPEALTNLFKKHWAIKKIDANKPLSEQLSEILCQLKKQNQHCFLIIDHANLLPISVLAALCHLSHQQANHPPTIRIILAGESILSSKIKALFLKKYALPIEISISDTPKIQTAAKKKWLSALRERHPVKSAAIISLCACMGIWWKLQSTQLLVVHAPHPIHQTKRHYHA